eukprot:159492_1
MQMPVLRRLGARYGYTRFARQSTFVRFFSGGPRSTDGPGMRKEVAVHSTTLPEKLPEDFYERPGTIDDNPDLHIFPDHTGDLLFDNALTLGGPFGTEEFPVLVPSRAEFRLVACVGGRDGHPEHELGWILLRAGPIHRCPGCGQCFVLDTTHPGHIDHPDHEHYEKEKEVWNTLH